MLIENLGLDQTPRGSKGPRDRGRHAPADFNGKKRSNKTGLSAERQISRDKLESHRYRSVAHWIRRRAGA
jgi:hypothetical protein